MSQAKHAAHRVIQSPRRVRAAIAGAAAATVLGSVGVMAMSAVPAGAATTASGPICSNGCAWEQLAGPSGGYDLDVSGQRAAAGTPVIAWHLKPGDPAGDFTIGGKSGEHLIYYTPFTDAAGAAKAPAGNERTQAEAAYDSSGNPRYCIGAATAKGGHAELVGCDIGGPGLPAGYSESFVVDHQQTYTGYAMFAITDSELTSSPMALNDAGYGKNGSPIITWPASGASNEEFWPNLQNVGS